MRDNIVFITKIASYVHLVGFICSNFSEREKEQSHHGPALIIWGDYYRQGSIAVIHPSIHLPEMRNYTADVVFILFGFIRNFTFKAIPIPMDYYLTSKFLSSILK